MWRPLSCPPGEVAASGLGASPGIAPGLASQKATARSPGRQPFWPTQSHLLHSMALQWPERAERALSTPNPNPILASLAPSDMFPKTGFNWTASMSSLTHDQCSYYTIPLPSVSYLELAADRRLVCGRQVLDESDLTGRRRRQQRHHQVEQRHQQALVHLQRELLQQHLQVSAEHAATGGKWRRGARVGG